jgi:hypothetical protein
MQQRSAAQDTTSIAARAAQVISNHCSWNCASLKRVSVPLKLLTLPETTSTGRSHGVTAVVLQVIPGYTGFLVVPIPPSHHVRSKSNNQTTVIQCTGIHS